MDTIQHVANQYSTPSHVHQANSVFDTWLDHHSQSPEDYPLPPILPEQVFALVKNLRRDTYTKALTRGNRLITATSHWRAFLLILKHLITMDLFPSINLGAAAFKPYKHTSTLMRRNQCTDGTLADVSMIPKNIDQDKDSFNTTLLVPLSIHQSDETYLSNYERQLIEAIETFKLCANREIRRLIRKHTLGKAYIESVDYERISGLLEERRLPNGMISGFNGGYRDPITDTHFFDANAGNPRVVRNLVAMVSHEMGGVPKPWLSKRVVSGPAHWGFLRTFGKNNLLPYLGILSSRTAAPFLVLLLLDNPRLNVESLLNVKVADKYGKSILLTKAGDDAQAVRITVEKPRANSQKHSILSAKSIDIISWLIKFTEPVRKHLIETGEHEEAKWLWLGITTTKHYHYGRLSMGQLKKGFQTLPSNKALQARETRVTCFTHSHRELESWKRVSGLRSLRVSAGVAVWLESNGDPVKTAQAFGHKGIQVTLNNYVPKAIQNALYERQIRRWQNIVICSASANKPYLLDATDFLTKEQLHEFLAGLFASENFQKASFHQDSLASKIRSLVDPILQGPENEVEECTKSRNKTLIIDDPDRVAVLLAYREKLMDVDSASLYTPDITTNSSPKMWLDLGNALCGNLPDEYVEIRQLIEKAGSRKDVVTRQLSNLVL